MKWNFVLCSNCFISVTQSQFTCKCGPMNDHSLSLSSSFIVRRLSRHHRGDLEKSKLLDNNKIRFNIPLKLHLQTTSTIIIIIIRHQLPYGNIGDNNLCVDKDCRSKPNHIKFDDHISKQKNQVIHAYSCTTHSDFFPPIAIAPCLFSESPMFGFQLWFVFVKIIINIVIKTMEFEIQSLLLVQFLYQIVSLVWV